MDLSSTGDRSIRFLCDAMLGGLARWLRAVGYEADFAGMTAAAGSSEARARIEAMTDDGVLVRRAAAEGSVLLSSDRPLFERRVLRDGSVRGLFVPRHQPIHQQLDFVMRTLALPVREPRCMRCGGALAEAPRDAVRDEAPPRALQRCDRFWRCVACSQLFWHGTHWAHIAATRERLDASFHAPRAAGLER